MGGIFSKTTAVLRPHFLFPQAYLVLSRIAFVIFLTCSQFSVLRDLGFFFYFYCLLCFIIQINTQTHKRGFKWMKVSRGIAWFLTPKCLSPSSQFLPSEKRQIQHRVTHTPVCCSTPEDVCDTNGNLYNEQRGVQTTTGVRPLASTITSQLVFSNCCVFHIERDINDVVPCREHACVNMHISCIRVNG